MREKRINFISPRRFPKNAITLNRLKIYLIKNPKMKILIFDVDNKFEELIDKNNK